MKSIRKVLTPKGAIVLDATCWFGAAALLLLLSKIAAVIVGLIGIAVIAKEISILRKYL